MQLKIDMSLKNNYYLSSFVWSTLAKVLNALWGFLSIPLLLGVYGKADYGILSLATACNGYMHLLDLGMNTGAVRFFSQWKVEGKLALIYKVARTNITFYLLISLINILGLVGLAIWGESLFSITSQQFYQLRTCLIILAIFSAFTWGATTFNQLLIANKNMVFIMQMQCLQILLKTLLIVLVLFVDISLNLYFFIFSLILALLVFPYALKCKKDNLINKLSPAFYWKDFNVVVRFSLSIFALSLFQVTATQSRPIILSIFVDNGASVVADFRIIEVIPTFIITLGGTFSAIFLPKASEMVAHKESDSIKVFAYKWTLLTSVLANILCVPFILCAKDVLSAYVGPDYSNLSIWLILWCFTVLIQIHTTPGNSLILAYGKTKLLVITTAISCCISIVLNALLCKYFNVGSAVIGYFIYVIIVIGLYYTSYYKSLIGLNRKRMILCFMKPTLVSLLLLGTIYIIPFNIEDISIVMNERVNYIIICVVKTLLWLIPYITILFLLKILDLKMLKT